MLNLQELYYLEISMHYCFSKSVLSSINEDMNAKDKSPSPRRYNELLVTYMTHSTRYMRAVSYPIIENTVHESCWCLTRSLSFSRTNRRRILKGALNQSGAVTIKTFFSLAG